jgi:acetylornithine deacetylase
MALAVVEELRRLVAWPTVSNRPLVELAAHLAGRAEDRGFRVERFEPVGLPGKCSVIASIGPTDAAGGLVMSGHMDVVPTEGQPWSSDPFRVEERGGELFGRGTADMKGFLAATTVALERIERREWTKRLVLIWTHDEEVGCLGSQALVEAWRSGPMPKACWIGEPTGFRILRMHPGHVAVEVVVHGEAAHSSRPDLGVNAIEGAADVVREVRAFAAQLATEAATDLPEMERPWVAVNVAEIAGGVAINVVPDRCAVRIGYRPLPGRDPLEVWERLRARLERSGVDARWEGRVLRVTPSLYTPAGTALEPHLDEHADDHRHGAASFATDGGNLAKLGMEPLVFGPGAIEVAHMADEHLAVADLVRAVDVVEAVVRRQCCS